MNIQALQDASIAQPDRPQASIPGKGMPGGFLSRSAVARLFGVSASTVTRWARTGLLKTIRTPGGHYRFPEEETRRAAKAGVTPE